MTPTSEQPRRRIPPVIDAVVRRFDVVAEDGVSIQLLAVEDPASNGWSITMDIKYVE